MTRYRNNLPQLSGELFITDGGMETTLFFQEGFDLPSPVDTVSISSWKVPPGAPVATGAKRSAIPGRLWPISIDGPLNCSKVSATTMTGQQNGSSAAAWAPAVTAMIPSSG